MKTFLHSALILGLVSFCCTCLSQQPAQTERVFVVPFSHLDLFWGGTEEECLSRGNRIISRAMQLADEHPEFRFLIEDEVFTDNFMKSHRGTPEADHLRSL